MPGQGIIYRTVLWALMVWAVALPGFGCADFAKHHDQRKEVYHGSWEYRYGDSPVDQSGSFAWVNPGHNDGHWQNAPRLNTPPGRGSQRFLWLRTRLTGESLHHETMLLQFGVYQSVEVFLDGQLVSRVGPLEGPAAERYAGKRPIYVPLALPHQGAAVSKTLTMRFFSPVISIGFSGLPRVGSHAELLVFMVKEGLIFLTLGSFLISVGIGVLVLYALDRRQRLYALYGLVSLHVGVYLCCRSPSRVFILESPTFWRATEVASLCLIAASISAFLAQLLEDWPQRIMRYLSWFFVAYFLIASMLTGSGLVHLEYVLWVLLYCIAVFCFCIAMVSAVAAWRGINDWRILATGFLVSAGLVVYTILQSLEVIHHGDDITYYSAVVFEMTLGIVMARRFRAFNKRLSDYSTVLQLSFLSSQDLPPGQQAQLVLAELLKMTRAERGLLFLCSGDGAKLDLAAGRDIHGPALRDSVSQADYDQRLISAVLQKRRPFVRRFQRLALSGEGRPKTYSAEAAPLLARGQLLGVIYLDAEALKQTFNQQDVEILLGLAVQIALTLVATRASKLEDESAEVRQRLARHGELLYAASRMADGDLQSPIAIPQTSELAPLAHALDQLRLDLKTKLAQLDSSHAAMQQLNEDLRFQLDQRLRRLLEMAPEALVPDAGVGSLQPAAPGAAAGDLLGPGYHIVGLIRDGSAGALYEVRRSADGRFLAAKIFNQRADKTLMVGCVREAQILARLHHPNVVSIVDMDLTRDTRLFLVMELVEGVPLSRGAENYRGVGPGLPILRQLAAGLSVLHERSICHRDLTPANVLVTEQQGRPKVKLFSFGAWNLLRSASEARALAGTSPYSGPELAQGAHLASPASDVFSLGVIAYELLSGELPPLARHSGDQEGGERALLASATLQKKCPGLSVSLAQLLVACLNADPAKRPLTKDLLAALKPSGGDAF